MAVLHNVGAQIEKVDQQILQLLEHRVALCQEAMEEDAEALSPAHEVETVALWLEEADHRGLDDASTEKLCKTVMALCRKMAAE